MLSQRCWCVKSRWQRLRIVRWLAQFIVQRKLAWIILINSKLLHELHRDLSKYTPMEGSQCHHAKNIKYCSRSARSLNFSFQLPIVAENHQNEVCYFVSDFGNFISTFFKFFQKVGFCCHKKTIKILQNISISPHGTTNFQMKISRRLLNWF